VGYLKRSLPVLLLAALLATQWPPRLIVSFFSFPLGSLSPLSDCLDQRRFGFFIVSIISLLLANSLRSPNSFPLPAFENPSR
jgi:hypothetical protein